MDEATFRMFNELRTIFAATTMFLARELVEADASTDRRVLDNLAETRSALVGMGASAGAVETVDLMASMFTGVPLARG